MATTFQASTPPPPSSAIRTPSTPKYGYDDNYQAYSPRKSARVMQRSRDLRTTPPPVGRIHSSKKASSTNISSSPSSPQTASKKRTPRNSLPETSGRRVSGALTYDTTASAAAALGLPTPKNNKMAAQQPASATRNNSMLPTPAKTPSKRPDQIAPAVTSIARNLFAIRPGTDEEVMPSPKKKGRKRYTGFTLDSFEVEDDSTPIQIYTDSHDRVPEVDLSPDNPFYGEATMILPEPTKRSSKRRKVAVPGEGEQTVEELEQREDGLVYVFRGKKIFRKFTDVDVTAPQGQQESDIEIETEAEEILPGNLRRPLTRSSIKPRLLFPTPQQSMAKEMRSHTTEDEEADTDIEEPVNGVSTPMDQVDDTIATPKAPRFGPATPPTTTRATRSQKLDLSSSPAGPTSDDESISTSPMLRNHRATAGKVSPFDQWQRVKRAPAAGKSKKREGEALARGGEKKLRN